MSYVFLLARKILFKRRGSVLLAAGAVAGTIFLNIFATTVFGGVEPGITGDISNLRFGDLLVTYNRGVITTSDSQFVLTALSNPSVQGVAPRVIASSSINFTNAKGVTSKYGVETVGLDPALEENTATVNDTLTSGRLGLLYQNAVILGAHVADDLGAKQGDIIVMKILDDDGMVHIRRLHVIGISQHSGFSGFDDSAIVNIKTIRDMTGTQVNHSTSFIVKLKDRSMGDIVKAWLQARFPKLTVQTVEEGTRGFRSSIEQVVVFINLIGYAGMIASAMGVITILTMMVTGKTRDVGVLRALGIQQSEILGIFIIDGAIIGGLGSAVGGVLGTVITLYLQSTNVPLFGSFPLVITFTPLVLIFPISIGLMISLVASLYPAWRASRYKPAEAMRYF